MRNLILKPKFLILQGDGINCENETEWALQLLGAITQKVHVNDLLATPLKLKEFDGMVIPGGFSFGDELGSGQILALKLKHGLQNELNEFVQKGKPILGICNGFQVLVKLGLLPFPGEERVMSLDSNQDGTFIDRWSTLVVDKKSVCKWSLLCGPLSSEEQTSSDEFRLPVRHGEGRVILKSGFEEEIYSKLLKNGQIPFTYKNDFNGSYGNIAGVCDPSGLILGMMPHPEANLLKVQTGHMSDNLFNQSNGHQIFESIMHYLQ